LIISIVGGEGTGKTLLARRLGEALGLQVLEPMKDRLLAESGYHTLFEWDAATGGLERLVSAQVERETALASGIIDGGAVELFCLVQRWAWHRLSPNRSERMRDLASAAARRYQRVLVMPPRIVGGPAPGRFRSLPHNVQLTRLIDAFAREEALPLEHVDDGPADARVAQGLAWGEA